MNKSRIIQRHDIAGLIEIDRIRTRGLNRATEIIGDDEGRIAVGIDQRIAGVGARAGLLDSTAIRESDRSIVF